jgi:hypothetical protein
MLSKHTHRLGKAFPLPRPRVLGKQADPAPKDVQANPSEAPAETQVVAPGAGAADHVDLAADNSVQNDDDVDSRMEEIREILDHAAMPLLDKGELVAEWVRYAEAKLSVFGQIVPKPKGGRPEGGVARAARELPVRGKSPDARRKFIERAIKIDGIWPEAKQAARAAGLDNVQSTLLEIAEEHSPDAQIAKVQEIAARKAMPRGRESSTTDSDESASSLTEVERLKTELAAANDRKRELEQELETARGMASRTPPVGASMKAPPTDEDIPDFLDIRPLLPADQLMFDAIKVAWNSHVQNLWNSASEVVRERVKPELFRADSSSHSTVG